MTYYFQSCWVVCLDPIVEIFLYYFLKYNSTIVYLRVGYEYEGSFVIVFNGIVVINIKFIL
jgi:hypothetical protein